MKLARCLLLLPAIATLFLSSCTSDGRFLAGHRNNSASGRIYGRDVCDDAYYIWPSPPWNYFEHCWYDPAFASGSSDTTNFSYY
ncbi:MAG: hypothetical protein U1F71_15855 [Verrucomicrobiaceae bacterium]